MPSKKKGNWLPWIMVIIVFITGISMAWSQNKIIPIIDQLIDVFSIDKTVAGWLSSIFCVTSIIMAIPSAKILAQLGVKKSGMLALVFTFAGSCLGIVSSSFSVLFISRIIEGIGVGMISVIAPCVINMWFPQEKRGLPMGIWGSWQMVAQGANFFLAVAVTERYGWKGMWYFGMVLTLVAAILYGLAVKSPDEERNYAPIEDSPCFKKGLRCSNIWILSAAGLFFTFSYFGWCTWIVQYWTDVVHVDAEAANNYLGYMCMIEIPVVLVVGEILDRVRNRKSVAIISSVLYIPVLFLSYFMENPALIVPFIIIYPIVEGGIPTFLWTVIGETVKEPKDSGIALAALTMCMNLGTVIGPPVIGYIIENISWHMATLPLCISILMSIFCICRVKLYKHAD